MDDLIDLSCPGTPALSIPHLGIQFVDGAATAPHDLLPKLAAYQHHHGVVIDGPAGDAVDPDAEPEDAEPVKALAAKRSPSRNGKPFG